MSRLFIDAQDIRASFNILVAEMSHPDQIRGAARVGQMLYRTDPTGAAWGMMPHDAAGPVKALLRLNTSTEFQNGVMAMADALNTDYT